MASIMFKIARTCNSEFKCNYLKNEKHFLDFLFHFWNLRLILNIFKVKIIVIANVFSKLQTVKNLIRTLSKERRFRTGFGSQHVKSSEILVKTPCERFFHVFPSLSRKLVWKMSPLVLGEILGVFVNTLNPESKYPVQDGENLEIPIQMQLSEKRKTFSQFFLPFLELHQFLNILKREMIVIANIFPKLETVKNLVRTLSKEQCFKTGFGSQHVKASQILAKSPWEHFYHVFHHSQGSWFGKCLP